MIDEVSGADHSEKAIVLAMHQAIRQRFAQIALENLDDADRENRIKCEFDRWRWTFARAQTREQVRQAICNLFGQSGINPILQEHWPSMLPWLKNQSKWRLVRDLALLALASYPGLRIQEVPPGGPSIGNQPAIR